MISADEIRAICFAHHDSSVAKKPLAVFTGFARSDESSFPSLKGHGLSVTFGWGMCRIWHILIGLSDGVYA